MKEIKNDYIKNKRNSKINNQFSIKTQKFIKRQNEKNIKDIVDTKKIEKLKNSPIRDILQTKKNNKNVKSKLIDGIKRHKFTIG